MKQYFGYIRVSTGRQSHGVSLPEQREAIERYAARKGLTIGQWFEEKETASKPGKRPIFSAMLKLLRQGKAAGVIVHKLDRSVRTLEEWAELTQLLPRGVDINFANDDLDLHTRSGRLAADIQAVVAADYSRNLREEARKGFYGRLKQGIYPMRAPVGYLNCGAGKPKEIDPVRGPMVRQAFELYATGNYTVRSLTETLRTLGLRNRAGKHLSVVTVWEMIQNPFYMGLIRIKRTRETFQGAHEPLISSLVFKQVQDVLHGRAAAQVTRHEFVFRRLLRCGNCKRVLIGERQRSYIYYRCHTCRGTSIRQEEAERAVLVSFDAFALSEENYVTFGEALAHAGGDQVARQKQAEHSIRFALDKANERLTRLTDAFLDQTIEKDLFQARKNALLYERRELQDKLSEIQRSPRTDLERADSLKNLVKSASNLYREGTDPKKRNLVKIATSNIEVKAKEAVAELDFPFSEFAKTRSVLFGGANSNRSRTKSKSGTPQRLDVRTTTTRDRGAYWYEFARKLLDWLAAHPEFEIPPELSPTFVDKSS
jgi:site-specific DNA recombinase